MGTDWDPGIHQELLSDWQHWGSLRHMNFMTPSEVADAVVATVTAPPGVALEVQLVPTRPPGA